MKDQKNPQKSRFCGIIPVPGTEPLRPACRVVDAINEKLAEVVVVEGGETPNSAAPLVRRPSME